MTFADGGQWIFRSSTESASSGIRRLWRIVDRNGNIVELEYDINDRLERVINAVGQSLELEYDTNDHILAVVAKLDLQTERRVAYAYYGFRDPDGNLDDLKSVTLPAIVNTVTGNDFPNGTTTTYTYSRGSSAAELNGNLLTIKDGLNQVYLRNTYATTTVSTDYEYDRLVSQTWGEVGDVISIQYAAVTPSSSNGFAVAKAWVNDRVGRVTEHFFDDANQLVSLREYTGFADPDLPTDDAGNLPTGKLRSADPNYFETRYEYNVDGHVANVFHPRGNQTTYVYEVDLNASASRQTRGNLREVHQLGALCNSSIAPVSAYYDYEPGLGNEHGEQNFVVAATDARGSISQAVYDSAGNRTAVIHSELNTREDMEYSAVGQLTRHRYPADQHGQRREVVQTYANDGRLRTAIVDPTGLALTTTQEYDIACNEIRSVDARGYDKLYSYNEHNQLTREQGPLETCSTACGGGTPTRAYTDRVYDANANLVRVDYQALECDGTPQSNQIISTEFEYDILNEDTVTQIEVSPTYVVTNAVELDANREVVVQLSGEAAAANDPNNVVTTIYDERGLVFQEIRGYGSALASTTQHDYDLNGNEVVLAVGLEGPKRTTSHTYDCVDRLTATVDPMGNRTEFDRDLNGNVEEQRVYGELVDVSGSTSNVLLARVTNIYDTMDRVIESNSDLFDPLTQMLIGDGQSITSFVYDGESRVIRQEDDNGHATLHDFDAAGRTLQTTDAAGNQVDQLFDANGNVVARTLTDLPTIAGSPQVGTWSYTYDARNNVVETVDPMGNGSHECYDSLGLLVESIDARDNRTLYEYDGAGRLLTTTYVLTADGTGAGAVVGSAVTEQVWDDSDRLIARRDPGNNVTQYQYDSLNRLTTETFADSSTVSRVYDIHDNLLVRTDPNGTVLTMTYDGLERLVDVAVSAGVGVNAETSYESHAYDGRSRLISATDDDSEVTRTYDSLDGLLSETQTYAPNPSLTPTPYTVSYTRDGVGNAPVTTYPAGRTISRLFDGLRRTAQIDENSAPLVQLAYLGPSVFRRTYVTVDTQSDYGYDLARRMTSSEHAEIGGPTIDLREYTFDDSGNKQSEQDLTIGSPTGLRAMAHDSLGRMVESDVSNSAATDRTVDYAFDGAGNRTSVTGSACAGTYTQVSTDALVNQYTETPCEIWSHDTAGNLVASDASATVGLDRGFEYDHHGRLVRAWVDPGTVDEVELVFAYDVLGRKIHTTRTDFNTIQGEQYIYDDGNVIEEYVDGGPSPSATYLYGDGLDERLQMIRGESWWYYDDELGSTSAVAYRDAGTLVIERYAYQDYGEPTLLSATSSGNPYLFAGSRWLGDVGLYDMRTRHFDPVAGRFISRDSIGIWGDEENLGNGYAYVGNAPDTYIDPTGEVRKPSFKNCTGAQKSRAYAALVGAENMALSSRTWFVNEGKKKRKKRKRDWNKGNVGERWFGKYQNTRFNRIMWNFRKISQRCQSNVIKFKCRSTGSKCVKKKSAAWTTNVWHSTIRLCVREGGGFFSETAGKVVRERSLSATTEGDVAQDATVMHEVSHNINPIGDPVGNKVADVESLANRKPRAASWSANNHEYFAKLRK